METAVTVTTGTLDAAAGSWGRITGFDPAIAFDQAATAMAFVSLDGRWLKVNRALCELLGRSVEDLVGRSFQELTHPDDLDAGAPYVAPRPGDPAAPAVASAAGPDGADLHRGPIRISKRYLRADGAVVHAQVVTTLLHDPLGRPVGYFSQTVDLTAHHQLSQQVRRERDRLRATLENSPMPMAELELSGNVVYWNRAAEKTFGWSSDEVAGSPLPTVTGDDHAKMAELLEQVSRGHSAGPVEFNRVRRDGTTLLLSVTCGPIRGSDGQVEGAVLAGVDVTEQRRMEQRLHDQAFCDPLTGLPNRARFVELLSDAVCRGSAFGLAIFDVSGLKAVNDTLGERAGDDVLVEVSRRLAGAMGADGMVARLGGDDFAVLMQGVAANRVADVVSALVEQLNRPFSLGNLTRMLSAVVGVTAFGTELPTDDTCACSPGFSSVKRAKELLREADMAMGQAKANRSSSVEWFRPELRQRLNERVELVEQLRQALDQEQLAVAFQPIFSLSDRSFVGAESLVRWTHPERGAIPPDRFVPLAERAGLVGQLDRYVMEHACASAGAWPASRSGRPLVVHVNASGAELMKAGFARQVLSVLERTGLDPSRLVVELTESVLVEGAQCATERLRQLKDLGVRLSVDDFGTGYSSLSYIEKLPVDEIKIDRSFVQDIHLAGPRRHGLLRSIVQLADVFELEVVAEGIESEDELDVLSRIGCGLGQGWLVSRAVPPAEFAALLRSGR